MSVSLNLQELKIEKLFKLCNCYVVIPSLGILEENFEWKGLAFTDLRFHFGLFFFFFSLEFFMCK